MHDNHLTELEAFNHGLRGMFSHPVVMSPETRQEPIAMPEWAPLVDISENDQEYLIRAELPEVKKSDVKVTAEAGRLTIVGVRKLEPLDQSKKYHRVERSYGSFKRCFSLPEQVSLAKVSAEFKDGILSVHLVKTGKSHPPQIEVKIA